MISADTEPLEDSDIAWFRDDFSAKPMKELLSPLRNIELPQGVEIPREARSIGATVRADRVHPSVVFTARLKDTNDRYFTYFLGPLDSARTVRLETTVASGSLDECLEHVEHPQDHLVLRLEHRAGSVLGGRRY